MNILYPICLYLAWVGFNTIFSNVINKSIGHPKYSLPFDDMSFSPYSIMVLFIGFPLLIFRKRLRRKRMKEYYEYVLEKNSSWVDFGIICGVKITTEEIENLNRMIKLEELKRKMKRKKFKLF